MKRVDFYDRVEVVGSTARITLGNGEVALADVSDLQLLSGFTWQARRTRWGTYADGRRDGRSVPMHRLILPPGDGEDVDHKNRCTLDNRRLNLRTCTRSQNIANTRSRSGTSLLKGVSRARNKWTAHITVDGKNIYLGVFDSEWDAGIAYDAAALMAFGEFANPNNGDVHVV